MNRPPQNTDSPVPDDEAVLSALRAESLELSLHIIPDREKLRAYQRMLAFHARRIFGADSEYVLEFGKINFEPIESDTSVFVYSAVTSAALAETRTLIDVMLEAIRWRSVPVTAPLPPATNEGRAHNALQRVEQFRKVFLAHGRDLNARDAVARVLEQCKLEPVILDEQASRGATILEKFERHGDVPLAVVLLTPDDVGRSRDDSTERPRARQNAIFELGFFFGKLGRSRVIAILETGLEKPSDIDGLVYISMSAPDWRSRVVKELVNAGLEPEVSWLSR